MRKRHGRNSGLPEGALSTPTVAWLCGMDRSTLLRWVYRGVLHPEDIGHEGWAVFAWNERSLSAAWTVGQLRKAGVSAQRVKRAADVIAHSGADLSQAVLVTDGEDVFEVLGQNELLDLTRRPGEVVCYPLGRWVTEVRTRAEEELGFQVSGESAHVAGVA